MPPRPRHSMPDFVRDELEAQGLIAAYQARPAYQQNDYLGWIVRRKHASAREKRLAQILDELEQGDAFRRWPGIRSSARSSDNPSH